VAGSDPLLWAAWAAFGLTAILATIFLVRAAVRTPVPEPVELPDPARPWLYCEDGAPLDLETRWFTVRPGGQTVLGSRPRSATADTSFVFLAGLDIEEDHALILFDPSAGRYRLRAPALGNGAIRLCHNNEPVAPGEEVALTDGDTLALGSMTRFRFTLTGPPERLP
jgi:hypothetical protein